MHLNNLNSTIFGKYFLETIRWIEENFLETDRYLHLEPPC